jgi:hypothetical protein
VGGRGVMSLEHAIGYAQASPAPRLSATAMH